MPAAIAQILASDLRVQLSGMEMVDAPIPPIFPHRSVALGNELLRERMRAIAALGSNEIKKLSRKEVPGMSRHKV
jgi:hypothetical protein